jgi:large subunit ribosomal protein L3
MQGRCVACSLLTIRRAVVARIEHQQKGKKMKGIIGKKVGMTQIFDTEGNCIPVTVVQAGPCFVTQIKSHETDRYTAVQLGFDPLPERKLNKPEKGHLEKSGVTPLRTLSEFRISDQEAAELKLGQQLDVSMFKIGDFVDISGKTKGRGFAGVIKRHNFSGFKATHGTHEYFRHVGSIGCREPQHTVKGRKMPGRYGGTQVTTQNLKVVQVRAKDHLILIKGALPGASNSLLYIRKATKKPQK